MSSSSGIYTSSSMNAAIKEDGNDLAPEVSSKGPFLQTSDKKKASPQDNNEANFTIPVYKNFRIRIYKPLIPLKIVLFCWYGGGSFVGPFLTIYLKQRGMTLTEISTAFTLSPIAQFLGTVTSGIAADKIGRSKPILIANLIFSTFFLGAIFLVPPLTIAECESKINLKCHPKQFDRLITKTNCDVVEDVIEINSCNVECPENVTEHCDGRNLICEILAGEVELRNFSLSITVNGSHKFEDRCFYNVSSMSHENETYSWCNVPHKMFCRVSCHVDSGIRCRDDNDGRYGLLITTMLFYIMFITTFSNVYRFLDVTTMSLVDQHDSDFGRERFFSIAGMLIISPVSGYLVDSTTQEGGAQNYSACFYVFATMVVFILVIVYKLEVRITSPGKKMFKRATYLLKNPDVMSFAVVVFVLGTAFSFSKNYMFWFLDKLHAPSVLIGFIPAMSALYGLPFLVTSRWWVKKIGPTQIFVLGLIGYVINTTGYSFLKDPWYSLILESTNILTYHLLWVAVILHSHELAPEGLTATVIATAGSIHYHIGKCSGSLIGGLIWESFGARIAFRVMGIICLIFAVIYCLYLYIRRTCFTVSHHIVAPGTEVVEISNGEQLKTKD